VPVIRMHRRLGAAMTLTGGVAVASLAFASLPLTAGAATPAAASTHTHTRVGSVTPAAAAASYLVRRLQGPHHNHYSSTFDGTSFPSYGETIDAALSMDAAGAAQSAVKRMTSYLQRNVSGYAGTKPSGQFSGYSPGAIGKLLLIAEAQHVNVRHFGGTNLVAEVRSTEGARGAKRGEYQQNLVGTPSDEDFTSTTGQALAMLGLANSSKSSAQPDNAARAFLKAQQCANGGFPTQLLANPKTACHAGSDIDSTGYAVQALLATGNRAAALKGARYLRRVQHKNGGFGASGGNANSTALAIQALVAAKRPLGNAVRWLGRQQIGCAGRAARRGGVNFQQGYDAASTLLATSQAGAALARAPLATISRKGAKSATPRIRC
jgi:hypothetical protein